MVTIALRLMFFKSQGYAMSARLFLALLACPDDFSLFIYWRARQSLSRGLDLSPRSSMIPQQPFLAFRPVMLVFIILYQLLSCETMDLFQIWTSMIDADGAVMFDLFSDWQILQSELLSLASHARLLILVIRMTPVVFQLQLSFGYHVVHS